MWPFLALAWHVAVAICHLWIRVRAKATRTDSRDGDGAMKKNPVELDFHPPVGQRVPKLALASVSLFPSNLAYMPPHDVAMYTYAGR
jgi:hypothetical protein